MITPKVAFWLNIVYSAITGLTAASLEMAGVGNGDAIHVIGIAGLIAMPLNLVLHAYSAPSAGIAVPK